jgi:TatD DNase family protein
VQTTTALSKDADRIRTALGLHPQLAAERKHELSLFDELLPTVRYVGEIGLDGGDELKATFADQLHVFTHILNRCSESNGRILSIHTRRATTAVLDQLEKFPSAGTPILHWFSGTHRELERAIGIGCWFSVGPAMLKSKKGSEIARRIPRNRILTETDGPFAQYEGRTLQPWDVDLAVAAIADNWSVPTSEAEDTINSNLKTLVSDLP